MGFQAWPSSHLNAVKDSLGSFFLLVELSRNRQTVPLVGD